MIEQLFGSKTRVKLLQLFFSNPNRSFYVREITRKIDEQINSVRRELSNLLNIGIITSDNTNNRLYYEVNQKFAYFAPLQQIFGGDWSVSTKEMTEKTADYKALGNVDLLLFTGQFTRDESSGIDVLIVGNLNTHAVQKYINELEKREGKEIRYTTMSASDFEYRQQINDRFITLVQGAKKQILFDKRLLLTEGEK
jgi:predicted transcriptional regulator